MSYYHGQEPGHTPGVLSGPGPEHSDYVWWEAGALWGTMVDYWKYTGDSTYNDIVQALAPVPGRPGQELHVAQRDHLHRQRRPVLLGPVGHVRRRVQLPEPAGDRPAVARPRAGRLQHADRPVPPRRLLRRGAALAGLHAQQRPQLQEHHLQRAFLQPGGAPGAVHWRRVVRAPCG